MNPVQSFRYPVKITISAETIDGGGVQYKKILAEEMAPLIEAFFEVLDGKTEILDVLIKHGRDGKVKQTDLFAAFRKAEKEKDEPRGSFFFDPTTGEQLETIRHAEPVAPRKEPVAGAPRPSCYGGCHSCRTRDCTWQYQGVAELRYAEAIVPKCKERGECTDCGMDRCAYRKRVARPPSECLATGKRPPKKCPRRFVEAQDCSGCDLLPKTVVDKNGRLVAMEGTEVTVCGNDEE